jgi:hypothetical protein
MDHPPIHPEVHSPLHSGGRKLASDSVYQIAIIIAALLLVITASLF